MDSLSPKPRIVIACGGTGGHLFPGLAVARQLVARNCDLTLLVSPKDVDQQAVKNVPGMKVVTLPAVALQRGSRIAFVRGFVRSFLAARRLFKTETPQAALAMGGFTSVPPVLAARRRGARTFLHESNVIPGRANRALSRFVDAAFVGFQDTASRLNVRNVIRTGTPVRGEFQAVAAAQCRRDLGLDPARPVVLVMGGSQGASGVNQLILRSLPLIQQQVSGWQWLHLTGPNDADTMRAAYAQAGLTAVVHPFFSRMEAALGAADVAVSRSGASSLAEFAAMQLPPLLVPLPTAADNHQFFNAQAFVQTGAARMADQRTTTPEQLIAHLRPLVQAGAERAKVQSALAQWHAPNAAADIATQILAALPMQAVRSIASLPADAADRTRNSARVTSPAEVAV
jgi:UDP-N-acetylglucosamine--N-acetylmuramyl-(pentapeptide) pyrophosphoryl-undecaprenol N-acetylglucosamine transferase